MRENSAVITGTRITTDGIWFGNRIWLVTWSKYSSKAIANSHGLQFTTKRTNNSICCVCADRLCGLVVRVVGYRSGGPGSIPGTNRKKKI
jgi:hypothetical protein